MQSANEEVNPAMIIHQAIKQFYLSKGKTEAQWKAVSNDPAKFNIVWRRALRLSGEGVPPEHLRKINPETGEILK